DAGRNRACQRNPDSRESDAWRSLKSPGNHRLERPTGSFDCRLVLPPVVPQPVLRELLLRCLAAALPMIATAADAGARRMPGLVAGCVAAPPLTAVAPLRHNRHATDLPAWSKGFWSSVFRPSFDRPVRW